MHVLIRIPSKSSDMLDTGVPFPGVCVDQQKFKEKNATAPAATFLSVEKLGVLFA